jgi:hypothetical protein
MKSQCSTLMFTLALATWALLAAAMPAWAGTSIQIMVPGQPTITINDGDTSDDDADPMGILYDFSVAHPLGYWSATGTIIATGGELIPPVTIVTDVLIQKHFGDILDDTITVVHYFTSFLTAQPYVAKLDGHYDNLQFTNIGVADLDYFPSVNNESIGVLDPPPAMDVPGPTMPPFDLESGPLYPMTQPLSQTILLRFYLDIPGDAIIMYNSASIEPPGEPVPTPVPSLAKPAILVTSLLILFAVSVLHKRSVTPR